MRRVLSIVLALILSIPGAIALNYIFKEWAKPSLAEITVVPDSRGFVYSEPVEVNGVRFEAFISQRNLPAPLKQSVSDPNYGIYPTKFIGGIRITNNTVNSFRFTSDKTLFLQMLGLGNQEIEGGLVGDRGKLAEESDSLLVLPGKSANLFLEGIMNWLDNNKLAFQMHNIFGFTYIFEPPSFSEYKLRFSYKNYKSTLYAAQPNTIELKPVAGFWIGKVTTRYVDFDIVQHD